MDDLTISDIDDNTRQRLKQRAALHGRSMEAEASDILRDVLAAESSSMAVPKNIAAAIRSIVEPLGGMELETMPRMPVREPPVFE